MVGAWLTEALIALYGFAGLRDAMRLLYGLLDQFWDSVYPQPDDGDLEPRAAPLVWLMDADRGARLPNRIREIALLPNPQESFSWLFWKSRYPAPKGETEDEDTFARRKAEAQAREQRFESAASGADVAQVRVLYDDMQGAKSALADFDRIASERFGDLAPARVSSVRPWTNARSSCGAYSVTRAGSSKIHLVRRQARATVRRSRGRGRRRRPVGPSNRVTMLFVAWPKPQHSCGGPSRKPRTVADRSGHQLGSDALRSVIAGNDQRPDGAHPGWRTAGHSTRRRWISVPGLFTTEDQSITVGFHPAP